ncbi:MAG: hypothetical protein Fur0034_02140 [Desulfuromonadia bacterium]
MKRPLLHATTFRSIVTTLILSLILFIATVQYRQYTYYQRGVAAEAKGDLRGALSGYEAAIHFHTPFSPLVERSAARIWKIAEDAEKRGEIGFALIAYRALRSSFYAARSLYIPGERWIRGCNERIVQLEQREASLSPTGGER